VQFNNYTRLLGQTYVRTTNDFVVEVTQR